MVIYEPGLPPKLPPRILRLEPVLDTTLGWMALQAHRMAASALPAFPANDSAPPRNALRRALSAAGGAAWIEMPDWGFQWAELKVLARDTDTLIRPGPLQGKGPSQGIHASTSKRTCGCRLGGSG